MSVAFSRQTVAYIPLKDGPPSPRHYRQNVIDRPYAVRAFPVYVFAIYPSGYLLGKDSHTPLMKRACSSVDTVARQVITTSLLATGAPGSVNYLLERERERIYADLNVVAQK